MPPPPNCPSALQCLAIVGSADADALKAARLHAAEAVSLTSRLAPLPLAVLADVCWLQALRACGVSVADAVGSAAAGSATGGRALTAPAASSGSGSGSGSLLLALPWPRPSLTSHIARSGDGSTASWAVPTASAGSVSAAVKSASPPAGSDKLTEARDALALHGLAVASLTALQRREDGPAVMSAGGLAAFPFSAVAARLTAPATFALARERHEVLTNVLGGRK